MSKYGSLIFTLQNEKIITDNFKIQDDILLIDVSPFVTVILHQEDTILDMYINNHYFGDISKNDIGLLFKALIKEDKVFIEYRRPKGLYFKEYFRIMNIEEFQKKKDSLLKRRGTKIYSHTTCFMDKY